MTKPELVAFIMENTSEYKKTHLMEKYKTELEVIATAFCQPAEHENLVLEQVTAAGLTEPKAIAELTISVIQTYAGDLTAFCLMNDNERKMLETIPLMAEYENADSKVAGKNFLQKVKELRNIEITTSRALMVQLKRKKYIAIEGSKEKYIVLLERGIKHLQKVS